MSLTCTITSEKLAAGTTTIPSASPSDDVPGCTWAPAQLIRDVVVNRSHQMGRGV